jgi:hypothetical protein
MSEAMKTAAPEEAPITLDDLRHKALAIRAEVQDEVREQVTQRRTQIMLVGAVAVFAVISLAYYAGSRAAKRAAEPPLY